MSAVALVLLGVSVCAAGAALGIVTAITQDLAEAGAQMADASELALRSEAERGAEHALPPARSHGPGAEPGAGRAT